MPLLLWVFTPITLIFAIVSTSEMSRSRPWRSDARMKISTGNTVSRLVEPHSVSSTRSGLLAAISAKFLQLARWIDTPLPRVTKPTIGSGGAGLQQRASCVISPSVPTTSTPDLAPCSTLDARLLLTTASSAGCCGCGGASCSAASTWRRLNFSLPTAMNRSSTFVKPSLCASASRLTAVLPSRCKDFSTSARPCASVSASSAAWNHARTFERVRLLTV